MPSRHSGSSHSSSFRSSSFSGGSSFSRSVNRYKPSSHSSSTHNLSNSFRGLLSGRRNTYNNAKGVNNLSPIQRQRRNQPFGYYNLWWRWFRRRPIIYYCLNHNYTYYPESWTSRGRTYKSGYYDEDGRYYAEQPFIEKKVGKIYTKCPSCGHVESCDYMDFDELGNCPNCRTRMKIAQDDDDIFIKEEEYGSGWKRLRPIGWIAIVLMVLLLVLSVNKAIKGNNTSSNTGIVTQQNTPYIGYEIFLLKNGNNYKLTNGRGEYDKRLTRDFDDNYYDKEFDLYLYYNKEHNVWQYWYEPISGKYEDYGWMEHDKDGWWIEVREGSWSRVPSSEDTSRIYWVE